MPVYEYQCTTCERIFEVITIRKDKDPHKCPDCGHNGKKILSSSTYRMKGYSEKNGYSNTESE
jgi:putative FmdB family regulatory protein